MKKNVLITGAGGTIGRAMAQGLADDYDLQTFSYDEDGIDLTVADDLEQRFAGLDAVIHLAWVYTRDEVKRGELALLNLQMHRNVMLSAKRAGVKRFVGASSVHADFFYDWMGPGLLSTDRQQRANGLYGGLKLAVEALDEEHADDHFRIADLRYGGVTDSGNPHPRDTWERRVWLSHPDLMELIRSIIAHEGGPNWTNLYAVSDNEHRVHDTVNPFGWTPKDRATADIRAELSP